MQRIYAGQKYPHEYTLSIRQVRIRVRSKWCITFQHMSTITKLSPDVTNITRILHHRSAQMREYKEMYKYEQYKWHSRVYRSKTRETRSGLGRMGLWTVCRLSKLPLRFSGQQLEDPHTASSETWT